MARSSLIVMAAFVASKAVGLLRERAIAHRFGAGSDYDAYVAAFNIPDLLFTLVAGGALVSAFLPVFSAALARGERQQAWLVASGVTNLVFIVTLGLSGIAALIAPWLVSQVLAPGFDPGQQALTVELMRIILLSTLVFAVSGIQMGILNAYQHFLLPALAPVLYNVGILIGALWLAPRHGIHGLAYGVVLGAVLHLVVKVPALVRYGFRYAPILGLTLPGVRQVLSLMWPRLLALGTVKAVLLVNVHLASRLPQGSLSALNYGWVISQMPQTILGTAIATVAFPTLAELAALDRRDELSATAIGALRVVLSLSVPAATGLWVISGPAIDVLLRSGAFDADATVATRLALRMFALGLVGHVLLEVVARTYYAQKDTLTPLVGATIAMVVNIVLAIWLVKPLAHGGLALANSIAVTAEVVLLLWFLAPRLGGRVGPALAAALWRIGAAGAVMAVVAHAVVVATAPNIARWSALVAPSAEWEPFVAGLLATGAAGTAGLTAYVFVAWGLGLSELQAVVRMLRAKRPRRSSAGPGC